MSEDIKDDNIYTIADIICKVKNSEIELPPIQRGFVWSPKKIEDIWDSMLRGFPIGSFICKKNGKKIEILDGQQRLTSILLGFDWSSCDTKNNVYLDNIKSIQNKIKIFLDLIENIASTHDFRKYNTRVITTSHPWGYQRKRNDKILSYSNINNAKNLIEKQLTELGSNHSYWDNADFFNNSFPYDCERSVKFSDFMPEVKSKISKYQIFKKDNSVAIQGITDDERKILEQHQQTILNTRIPFIFIKDDDQNLNIEQENEEILDTTEYLFTLINTAGQRISNDDLNYSLVKSALMSKKGRKYIDSIDEACQKSHILPSRFATICYFLYNKAENLTISTRRFRSGLQAEEKKFIAFLDGQFNNNGIIAINRAEQLMVYTEENNTGIPYIWFLDIINQNMPLTFLIMYMIENEQKFEDLNLYITSIITTLYIFGYKKRQRNTLRTLVQNFVKLMKSQTSGKICDVAKKFFEEQKQYMDYLPISPNNFNVDRINTTSENKKCFEYYIKWEKALLLYAQRKFLSNTFSKGQFTLDDMNRPFDYDHIFPSVERGKNNCINWDTIGNFRAWPYDKNRSDQDDAPIVKFKTNDIYDNKLLEDSFCISKDNYINYKHEFENIGTNIRKDRTKRRKAEDVIRRRIYLIYEEWYNNLKINKIIG